MKKAIKWILIIGGGLPALAILAILIIPMAIQDYKPRIENKSPMPQTALGLPSRFWSPTLSVLPGFDRISKVCCSNR